MKRGLLLFGVAALALPLLLAVGCGGDAAEEGGRPGLEATQERSPVPPEATDANKVLEPTATAKPTFAYVAPVVSIPTESRVYVGRIAPSASLLAVRNTGNLFPDEGNEVWFSVIPGSPIYAPCTGFVVEPGSGSRPGEGVISRSFNIQDDPVKYPSEKIGIGLTGDTLDPSIIQGAAISAGQFVGTASDRTLECPLCPREGLWNVSVSHGCVVPPGDPSGSSVKWCDIYVDEQGDIYVAK